MFWLYKELSRLIREIQMVERSPIVFLSLKMVSSIFGIPGKLTKKLSKLNQTLHGNLSSKWIYLSKMVLVS